MMSVWDKSIKVGDLVLSNYHKGSSIYKVLKVQKRFLTKDDLKYDCYKQYFIGDEYSPLVTITPIVDTTFKASLSKKKLRGSKSIIDCSYLYKLSKQDFDNYLKYLSDMFMNI